MTAVATAPTLREHPILFTGPMVRAILDGSKTQTRRVLVPQPQVGPVRGGKYEASDPWIGADGEWRFMRGVASYSGDDVGLCRFGQPGDRLWVREAHAVLDARPEVLNQERASTPTAPWSAYVTFDRDFSEYVLYQNIPPAEWRESFDNDHQIWRPSIHMPRWACRLVLELTDVRIERLQEITAEGAIAEGIPSRGIEPPCIASALMYLHDYEQLWNGINAKRGFGWDVNPWVWVLSFRRATS